MRIGWLFTAAGVVVLVFGLGLLVVPAAILTVYGMSLTPDGEVLARLLGGQLLGYVGIEYYALRGGDEVRLVNLRSVLVAEILGFVVSGLAALQGRGNSLFWGVVAIFFVFAVWRGYHVLTYRGRERS